MTRFFLGFTMTLSAVSLFVERPARGETQPPVVTVDQVVTATSDVRDLSHLGDRLLIATSGGLVIRRNGRVEQTLTSLEGLPGTRLRSVTAGQDGHSAWVSSIEGVALIRFGESGHARVERTYGLRRVQRVVRYAGATWFASYGNGLFRLEDGSDSEPEPVVIGRHPTHGHQTDLAVSGEELLVATAGAGIFRLGPDGRLRGRIRENRGLASDIVWSLEPEGERVFVSSGGGISVIRDGAVLANTWQTRAATRLPVRDVRSVVLHGDAVWVGTHGAGVFVLEENRALPRQVGGQRARDRMRRAQSLLSAEGGVLVGHSTGLHHVSSDGHHQRVLSLGGLPSSDITAIARAFGALWIGTFSHGLAQMRGERPVADRRAMTRWRVDHRINDLAVTDRGGDEERLWIATDRGLYWYDGRRFAQVIDPQGPGQQHTTNLYVHPDTGDLWVTSARQLSRLRQGRWESWRGERAMPIANLHSVTSDRRGNIWVGSLHGLFRFSSNTSRFERHSVSTGALPVDWVTALVPWERGVVAGTYHGGLSWFDGQHFTLESELSPTHEENERRLPSGWVNPHALSWHGEWLWIGTLERGLVVGNRGCWQHLTIREGLPSDDVTDILPDGPHSAWVATRGGLVHVGW